jgi:CheY-like chemotaxis protein
VTSELGRGSSFVARLPAYVHQVVSEAPSPSITSRGESIEEEPVDAPSLLVIDDDPVARDLLVRALTREHFRVWTATGAQEGVRLARELQPDAITLDVVMPGTDGWTALSALKADPATADIPVVMVTISEDRRLSYALGATDYLTKPVDRERLATVLRKIVAVNHAQEP